MNLSRDQLRLLDVILEVEHVDHAEIEPAYMATSVTVDDRVIYMLDDDAPRRAEARTWDVVEYPAVDARSAPWPTDPQARDRLRTLYPTLAQRQEAPAS